MNFPWILWILRRKREDSYHTGRSGKGKQMRRKKGFISHQADGVHYIVPVGKASTENHCLIRCNGTAFSVWNWLEEDTTEWELVHHMRDRYGIDQSQAENDVRMILQTLRNNNLLDES